MASAVPERGKARQDVGRRDVIRSLGSLALLPLASQRAAAEPSPRRATGLAGTASAERVSAIRFNGMAAPAGVAEQATVLSRATIDIIRSGGAVSYAQPLRFKTLYKTGQAMSSPDGRRVIAGGYYRPDGVTPIIDRSTSTAEPMFSDCPDGSSLIRLTGPKLPGIKGNPLFLVTQFEYKTADNAGNPMYAALPSPIGIVTLDQDSNTGELTARHYYNLPTDKVHGLWSTCAASLSPWNTHLSSEEYEPDAWTIASNERFKMFSINTFGNAQAANPYHYGHVPEVTVNPDGTGSVRKHYCLGRISREMVQVMPDQRTVLMGDDASAGGMFMFVADQAGNLASGSLYAARLDQTSRPGATDGGRFNIAWIKLGHASSNEVERMADRYRAADIISVKTRDPADASYTKINFGRGQQWVRVQPGMEKAAAFLETRRYAAVQGATMELTKFEGVSVNAKDRKAYIAISSIRETMTENGFAGDSIRLGKISAGAVYELTLGKDPVSGSIWAPLSMAVPAALLGRDMAQDSQGNTAQVNRIANPDNIKYSEAMRTLFIGEDSAQHLNNFVWAYQIDTGHLARVLSVPAGAECACLAPVDDANGFAYLLCGFQHPGDRTFTAQQAGLKKMIDQNWDGRRQAAVGYLSGLPCIGQTTLALSDRAAPSAQA